MQCETVPLWFCLLYNVYTNPWANVNLLVTLIRIYIIAVLSVIVNTRSTTGSLDRIWNVWEKFRYLLRILILLQFRLISIPFELKLINSNFFLIEIAEPGHKAYYLPYSKSFVLNLSLIPQFNKIEISSDLNQLNIICLYYPSEK